MNIPVFLNSIDGVRNSKSHDFTVIFTPAISLDKNKKYYISLDSANLSYSWYNVSSSYGNNTFKYSHDGDTNWTTVTLTNGNYSYTDLNSAIQQTLSNNSHSKTGITLAFVPSLFRVLVTLENNYQMDLQSGGFADLIGFNKVIVTQTGYGSNVPDITRSVDNIFVHTNLVSDSIVPGIQTDVLYRFSVDNLALSYPFHIEGKRLLWSRVNTNFIKELRVYMTDSQNRPVDLNNIPVNMTLLLREE